MGSIVTFYSFKGGVGRTMALANIAVLLARQGKNVLAVDWDLEAPGLHRYFARRAEPRKGTGLLHLLHDARGASPDWRSHVAPVELPIRRGALHLLPAGHDADDGYANEIQTFDWHEFFTNRAGGALIERLRDDWREEYDIVLVDSRTGYTDTGGVCTILLPDLLVAVFAANEQSLAGVEGAIEKAQAGRQQLDVDRPPLLVVPLPSRFDGRVEKAEAERWMDRFTTRLAPYYDDWLPRGTSYRRVVERTRVPHVPYFSFGEKLAVLDQSLTDPEGLAHPLDAVARLLAADLKDADVVLLGGRADPSSHSETEELAELAEGLAHRIQLRLWMTRLARFVVWYVLVLSAVGGIWTVAAAGSPSTYRIPFWAAVMALICALVAIWTVGVSIMGRLSRSGALRDALARLEAARRLGRDQPHRLLEAYESASDALRAASFRLGPSARQRDHE